MAGHSLGEYSALVAAEALSLAEALPLVRFRAQAMQEAVPVGEGAMAAILGLEAAAVREGCAQAAALTGQTVEAANFNDPRQTVIAGTKVGVDKACELLKAAGAVIALKLRITEKLTASAGQSFTAESLATAVGAPEKTELVFKVLEHLAANGSVKKTAKTPWFDSTYAA